MGASFHPRQSGALEAFHPILLGPWHLRVLHSDAAKALFRWEILCSTTLYRQLVNSGDTRKRARGMDNGRGCKARGTRVSRALAAFLKS